MRMGQFFSLQRGRVGQYLSPRVLVVRSPFQAITQTGEPTAFCCFGFEQFAPAQKFVQSLARLGLKVQLRQSQLMPDSAYEVVLPHRIDLAQTLAYWERRDRHPIYLSPSSQLFNATETSTIPAIAA